MRFLWKFGRHEGEDRSEDLESGIPGFARLSMWLMKQFHEQDRSMVSHWRYEGWLKRSTERNFPLHSASRLLGCDSREPWHYYPTYTHFGWNARTICNKYFARQNTYDTCSQEAMYIVYSFVTVIVIILQNFLRQSNAFRFRKFWDTFLIFQWFVVIQVYVQNIILLYFSMLLIISIC